MMTTMTTARGASAPAASVRERAVSDWCDGARPDHGACDDPWCQCECHDAGDWAGDPEMADSDWGPLS